MLHFRPLLVTIFKKGRTNMNHKKGFNILRIIAIFAIVCTFIMTVFMIVQSLLPADKSSSVSGKFTGTHGNDIVATGNGQEIKPTSLSFKKIYGYIGDKAKVNIDFVPKEATDTKVVYKLTNADRSIFKYDDAVTIDNKGNITFNHGGIMNLTVSLESDPSISYTSEVLCYGQKFDLITNLVLSNNKFLQGTRTALGIYDQKNEYTFLPKYALVSFSNNSSNISLFENSIVAKKVGHEIMYIKNKITNQEFAFDIVVLQNNNYIPIEKIEINPSYVTSDNTFNVLPYTKFNFKDLVVCEPKEAKENLVFSYDFKNPNDKTILSQIKKNTFYTNDVGEIDITATSLFEDHLNITIKINCAINEPNQIEILTKNIIVVDELTTIRCFDGHYYINDVTYEVIKGNATIENTSFRPKTLGKLVIKATYNKNPDINTTLTINVQLYRTFGQFIRKILGHLLLFMVLGFGFYCVYLFLITKRPLALPLAIFTGFGLACLSEALQLTAEGRYASWTDVFVDFFGYFFGVILALIIILLIFLVAKLMHRYEELKDTFALLSYKNIFKKNKSYQR